MEAERSTKLPEGVGKRIIEKLRNQEIKQEEVSQASENTYQESYTQAAFTPEAEEVKCEPVHNIHAEKSEEIDYSCSREVDFQPADEPQGFVQEKEINTEIKTSMKDHADISDVDTLMELITTLPSGVTKQTGAQIIRQTMEAMGISMNKVLSDAQMAQEDLEHSIRNNINVIEEYKTRIKILEQEILKFKKKAHELEDIISLFILSDKK